MRARPTRRTRLLVTAEAGPLDELARVRVDVLRAQIAFAESRGRDAPALLLRAARRLEPLDPLAARDTYLDALATATIAGPGLSGDCSPAVVARAALAAPPAPEPPRASDLLLDGMALLASEGYPAAAPTLRRALAAFRDDALPVDVALRWLWFAAHAALNVWDDESWELLATRNVALARQTGALTALLPALNTRAGVHLGLGELDEAVLLLDEVRAMSDATGGPGAAFIELALAGLRGDEGDVARLAESVIRDATSRGEGIAVNAAYWARAVLGNGLGHFDEALAAARQATINPDEVWTSAYGAVELIEAAARTGATETAAAHLERLAVATQASGTPFALGLEARCRALLSEGEAADRLYREAIDALAAHARARGARPRAPALRRVAAPRAPAAGGSRAAAHGAGPVHGHGARGVRRTGRARAARDRRDRPPPAARDGGRADRPGGPDRPAGARRAHQRRDRGAAVRQPPHGRVPPAQGLHQARHRVTHAARGRAPATRGADRGHPDAKGPGGARTSPHGRIQAGGRHRGLLLPVLRGRGAGRRPRARRRPCRRARLPGVAPAWSSRAVAEEAVRDVVRAHGYRSDGDAGGATTGELAHRGAAGADHVRHQAATACSTSFRTHARARSTTTRHGAEGHGGMSHDMSDPAMAAAMERDMRNRFFVALALTIPVVLYSPLGGELVRPRAVDSARRPQLDHARCCRRRSSGSGLDVHRRRLDVAAPPRAQHERADRHRRARRLAVERVPDDRRARRRSSRRRRCSSPSCSSATGWR